MSDSNEVKFLQDNGKWCWKRYDGGGSVLYRSPLFASEQEAREDYEAHREDAQASTSAQDESSNTLNAPGESNDAGSSAPEGDTNAGSASADQGSSI